MTKEVLLGFHRNIEGFFEARKNEAEPIRAFVAVGILILLFMNLLSRIFLVWYTPAIWLIAYFAAGYLIAKKKFQSKCTFMEFLYTVSIPNIFAFLILYLTPSLNGIINGIPVLGILMFYSLLIVWYILTPYFSVVSLKVVSGLSYQKTINYVILLAVVSIVLLFMINMIMASSFYPTSKPGSNLPDIEFVINRTNNSDGSFTMMYAYISNTSWRSSDFCFITFPRNWDKGNETIAAKVISIEKNKELPERYNLRAIFYNNQYLNRGEYFAFRYGPLGMGPALIPDQIRAYQREHDPFMESLNRSTIKGTGNDLLDAKFTNTNKTVTRHHIMLRSSSELGFEATYQSPYGQDQGLYYILNSVRCYKK